MDPWILRLSTDQYITQGRASLFWATMWERAIRGLRTGDHEPKGALKLRPEHATKLRRHKLYP